MNSEEFINVIQLVVRDAAVEDTLENMMDPPGRKPAENLLTISQWFKSLAGNDKIMLEKVMQEVANAAVFGFCAVLDGARSIENTPIKGDLELYFVKDGERVRLNEPTNPLHDIFNAE